MAMGKKEARRLLSVAKEARRAALMERASFGPNTEDIKVITDLYRRSWIVNPLDRIISALEQHS